MGLGYLRLTVFIGCLLLLNWNSIAQDSKLRLHALSFGAGIASTSSETSETGLGINFDFSTIVNRHIISFNSNVGTNIRTELGEESFLELNLTYGRKWDLGTHFVLEGHLGIGIFTFDEEIDNSDFNFDLPGATTGFPFRLKFNYYPSERFGIGLNPNINFNGGFTAYSLNFIFQYNFN